MDKVLNTDAAIYRITDDGRVFSQQKIKIPLCTKGRVWSGEIKLIIKPERELSYVINNRGYNGSKAHSSVFLKKPTNRNRKNCPNRRVMSGKAAHHKSD